MTKGAVLEAGAGGANGRRGADGMPYLGAGVSWGSRGLVRAWRRGVGVCVLLVAASFSFFLVTTSSKRAGGLYTRVIFTFKNAPGYIMDIMVPSHNASKSSPSIPSSSSSSAHEEEIEEEEGEEDRDGQGDEIEEPLKGFLVHTPGCVIPDFDPFHHTITRFISNPLNLTCKHPPALTTANGTTLYYHQHILSDHLESFLKVYEQRLNTTINTSEDNTTGNLTLSNGTSIHLSPESFRRFFLSATPPLTSSSNERKSDDMTIYFDFSSSNSSSEERPVSSFTSSTSSSSSPPPPSSSSTSSSSSPSSSSSSISASSSSATTLSSSSSAAVKSAMERLAIPIDRTTGVPKVKCCYRAIYRVEQKSRIYNAAADGRWKYSGWCEPLAGPETSIKEESILVYCNMSHVVVYKNVHYFIQRHKVLKPPLPQRTEPVPPKAEARSDTNVNTVSVNKTIVVMSVNKTNVFSKSQSSNRASPEAGPSQAVPGAEKLSVIIFGTDSASRLNMQRHLPKTYQYLTDTLGAVDLAGFNKVGDNTFPNLVPITIGLNHHELANHSCVPDKEKFDDCPWIWKDFKRNGYVTAFIEDSPWMGTYNYMHNGFVKQPTDFYGRAFFLASEKEIGNEKHGNSNVCQGDKLSIKVIQDFSLEVARTFLHSPSFSLYWSASVSHDYLNLLRHADLPHLDYLQQLEKMGALNHTALFFISDHGMRWGSIRSTYIGMLEERLPYVLVYLPPWFRTKYKTAFQNLQRNARRLTANFDLYETLYDLAYGRFALKEHVTSKPKRGVRGISLFKAIPRSRKCEDAGIPEHFCTCQDTHDIPLTDTVLDMAAAYLKGVLNKELDPYSQCVRFKTIELLTGRVSGSNKQLSPQDITSDVRSYLLQGRLTPGDVVVEATLRYNPQPQVFQLMGEVSRINVYGNTSHCIGHTTLRKFCFCKDQMKEPEQQNEQEQQNKQEKLRKNELQQQEQQTEHHEELRRTTTVSTPQNETPVTVAETSVPQTDGETTERNS